MNMMKMMMEKKKKKPGEEEEMMEEKSNPKILALEDIQEVLENIAMGKESDIFNKLKEKKSGGMPMEKDEKGLEEMIEGLMPEGEEVKEMEMAGEEGKHPDEIVIENEVSKDGNEMEKDIEELDENGKPIGFKEIKKRLMLGKR